MPVTRMLNEDTIAADAIARVLQDAGIDMVFGMSGGHTGRLFAALEKHQNAIRTVLVREESLGGVMAEVYGRLKRKPGVLIGQGPWVLGNGIIGILEGYLSSTPMLLLSDFSDVTQFTLHAPYQSGTGDYGSWDARSAFGGVTKEVFQALDPVPAVQATQLAIKHAMSGQCGPVAVLYGADALGGVVASNASPRIYPTGHYLPTEPAGAEAQAVEAAARALAAAKRAVIIAGNGVRMANAYTQLQALAEQLGLPVATSASGKGCFAETHPLALGVFGTFGTAAANACVGEADLVLVVGSKLGASDTCREHTDLLDPERQTFIQVDIEPRNASWTFPAEHVLLGDAAIVLGQLAEKTRTHNGSSGHHQAGEARVAGYRKAHGYFDAPAYGSDSSPIHPQRVIGELMRNLPAEAIVTCDAGENRILMTNLYQTKQAGGFLQAAGAGPMGFAIPAALATKLVHPDRPVLAITGDGGFAMTMNGLMTALEHDIPIVTVVFNNRALGWVLHGRGAFAAEFNDFDHAAIARSMGCKGIRITDPKQLAPAIKEALAARTPIVLDVVTALDAISFADVTSPLLNPPQPKRKSS
ncbi:MAG: thiamine pyrophosphate-binding protein [Variibacter sp.]|nr:thiamine pyrophosphate-binding protein [Variibacter sp.]